MSSADSELVIKPVETMDEALAIAEIRNTGREYMTHDQHEINEIEQAAWFTRTYQEAHRRGDMHAFIGSVGHVAAAYGMVQRKSGDYWLTGVVAPEQRGKGFGEQLFRFLGEYALTLDDIVYLDVLERNKGARHLYEKLGYEYVEPKQQNGVLIMLKEGNNHAQAA